jgi:hypothetical protein
MESKMGASCQKVELRAYLWTALQNNPLEKQIHLIFNAYHPGIGDFKPVTTSM